jgi:hypothetical protein
MNAIIEKSADLLHSLVAIPRAVVRGLVHIPEALAEVIEKHAIGK